MLRSALIVVCFAAACGRVSDESLGVDVNQAPSKVDVARLGTVGELQRALSLPGAELDARLGAHRIEANSVLKVEPPGWPPETLVEKYVLERDGAGNLHILHDNDRGHGQEAYVVGGIVHVRQRYGRFVQRKPEGEEIERLRAAVEGVPAAYIELLARFIRLEEAGKEPVAQRGAVHYKLAGSGASAGDENDNTRRWRNSLEVAVIEGSVALDDHTGAPLALVLQAQYAYQRPTSTPPPSKEGAPKTKASVRLDYQTQRFDGKIAAPQESAPMPRRARPLLDRQTLLEGLR